MSDFLVSIILPVYNAEDYLEKCIQSILNQEYKNIELIIVNDGSTDNSDYVCRKFSKSDQRVRYYLQENSGPSVARNKGIEIAAGEYVQFIDADDYLEINSIETLVTNIEDSDLVIAGYRNVYSENENKKSINVQPSKTSLYPKETFLDIFGDILEKQLFHYTWHKLYRTEIVKQIKFLDEMKIGEDLIFNLDYMDIAENITLINEVVYNHIWYNQTSTTKAYHDNLFLTRKMMHERLASFLIRYDKFYGKNKKIIEELYANRIIACFSNINKDSSPLSYQERVNEIKLITDDKSVTNIIFRFNDMKFTKKLYGRLLQKRSYTCIMYYSLFTELLIKVKLKISRLKNN